MYDEYQSKNWLERRHVQHRGKVSCELNLCVVCDHVQNKPNSTHQQPKTSPLMNP